MNRRQFNRSLFGLLSGVLIPGHRAFSQSEDYDFQFTRLMYESGDWNVDERMPTNLLNSLVEYTKIRVHPEEKVVALSSESLFEYPFCYMAGHRLVEFTKQEAANFRRYVDNGGFVFVDDCNHDIDGLFALSFEKQMKKMFGPEAFEKLPNDHDIYSCFFEFDGPPTTSFELNGWGDDLVHDYLKGIHINNRLSILYSNKDYGCEWDYDFRNKRWLAEDNTKFGVNIIVYALTA